MAKVDRKIKKRIKYYQREIHCLLKDQVKNIDDLNEKNQLLTSPRPLLIEFSKLVQFLDNNELALKKENEEQFIGPEQDSLFHRLKLKVKSILRR